LSRNLDNLNLNVDLDKTFGERIDVDKTRVNCSGESTELGDQTDVTLTDWLIWVWTNDAAWDGATSTNA